MFAYIKYEETTTNISDMVCVSIAKAIALSKRFTAHMRANINLCLPDFKLSPTQRFHLVALLSIVLHF